MAGQGANIIHFGQLDDSNNGKAWCAHMKVAIGSDLEPQEEAYDYEGVTEEFQVDLAKQGFYLAGAIGRESLSPRAKVNKIPPGKAGLLLAAVAGAWRSLALFKASPQKYAQLYYFSKARSDLCILPFFTSVLVVCDPSSTRHVVLNSLQHVSVLFFIVLRGRAFFSQEGAGVQQLERNHGYVFCPGAPVTLEAEGPSLLVVAYHSTSGASRKRKGAGQRESRLLVKEYKDEKEASRLLLSRAKRRTKTPLGAG